MTTLFNFNDYEDEMDFEYIKEDLSYILDENTKMPRGKATGYIFVSERSSIYGSISNNGAKGFSYKENTPSLLSAIINSLGNGSSNNLSVENDGGILKVTFYDHDGKDDCVIYPVIKSKKDKVDSMYQKVNSSETFEKFLNYVESLPMVKAI